MNPSILHSELQRRCGDGGRLATGGSDAASAAAAAAGHVRTPVATCARALTPRRAPPQVWGQPDVGTVLVGGTVGATTEGAAAAAAACGL